MRRLLPDELPTQDSWRPSTPPGWERVTLGFVSSAAPRWAPVGGRQGPGLRMNSALSSWCKDGGSS